MKPACRTRTLALHLLTFVLFATRLAAQDTCPRASGPDAEGGWAAYSSGDISGARVRFEAALQRCPDDSYARTGLGYVELRQAHDSVAVDLWTRVLRAQPDNVDALVGLGLAAWRAGDVAGVDARFSRVLELSPGHATALDYLARLTLPGPAPERPPFVFPDTLVYPSRTSGDRFEVRGPSGWMPFYVKAVNLGAALPGRHPSEFPDSATYAGWIRQMAEMNANAVRVYTIHPPTFYQALYDWNSAHPTNPLWLIHGVWTELPANHDFADPSYEAQFFSEVRDVVDLLHGRADIRPRPGHASGYYTADVSPWTLAYIIGREWEPFSAIAFDSIQSGQGGFEGRYVTVHGGNAMDAWMGRATDEVIAYETETYHAQRPIAYTNWPTLDPLTHPSEATVDEEMAIRRALGERPEVREREYDNDGIALDAALVTPTERLPAGYFASFHAYPYYPDFMILEDGYQDAASTMGRSNYFGYLRALKEHHAGMPVMISEYGVPASLGTGHLQPQGWHHGGLTEAEVADIDRRLTLELAEAGMAGGALFAWIDEWFKRNWVTTEFELPQDRNRLWYNRLDAEQHYGVVAMEADAPVRGRTLDERMNAWRRVGPTYEVPGLTLRVTSDEAYLWLLAETQGGTPGDTLMVGFDVIDPGSGDFRWPGRVGERLPVGIEVVLEATESEVRVMADPPSNPFRLEEVGQGARRLAVHRTEFANPPAGLFDARVEQRFNLPFYTLRNDDGRYDSLRVVVNRRRFARDSTEFLAVGYDRGLLPGGAAPDGFWERSANGALEVRIPWLLLNVTDPSSRSVLQGPGRANARDADMGADGIWRLRPGVAAWPDSVFGELGTQEIESIGLVAAVRGGTAGSSVAPGAGAPVARYTWPTWEVPDWTPRVRPTYDAMRDAFTRLNPYGLDATSHAGGAVQVDPANEAWVNGDTGRALELYEQRLLLDPNDGVALHRVALMRAWAEEYDLAHELFDRLLRVEPDNLDARVDEARVWAWAGETDKALDDLDSVLRDHPDYAGALEARALFEAWAGRYEESLSTYDELLAIAPDNGAARRQLAQVLSWASRFEASRAVYDSLLARNPDDIDSRLGLATALAFSDELDESIAQYDRILSSTPDHLGALQGKGRVLGWANRLVEAEGVLRHALSLDETNTTTLVGLAQVLRWQDRNAAALELLHRAEEIAPTNSDVREQLRGVHLALDPMANPSFVAEHDSDGNTMLTTALSASFHLEPRLEIRADGYWRDLQQSAFGRTAMGATLTASYQIEPGWTVSAGGGASNTNGSGSQSTGAYKFGLRSPARHPLVLDLSFASSALDATATLAENGVTTTGGTATLRWIPTPGWRLDAAAGRTRFSGEADNHRTNGFLSLSSRVGRSFTVGGSARFFWFEQDLTEGYFDPDFYGIAELTGRWLRRVGDWTLLLELAPGLQKVTKHGDPAGAFRGSASVAYQIVPGREISLSGGYSSTGLQSFSSGASDYRYTALIFGVNWVF